ncbi:MAG: alkaline phosphatase family protein, partial [Thermoplasmata archaeon]|nr:alkaline phosphatase family protein [Thermoplasmata archaeon]
MANDGSPPRVAGRSAWGRRRIGILGIVAIGTVLLLTIPGGLGVLRSPPPWSSSSVPKVPPAPTSPLPPTPNASTPFPTPIRHVFVVVLENAARSTVLQKGAFEATLASQYAQASAYYGICHPSAPNYLSMTGGSPRQCGSDNWNVYNATNLGDLAEAAGRTWKAYVESMPTPCDTSDAYPYAVKHNPFVFYSDIVTNATRCAEHDVNFTAFTSDVEAGTLPNLGFITPNLTDDGHDTSVATADAWLKGWLSPLMNDSFYNSSVFFVTYDESVNDNSGYNGTAGGNVFFAAVSPYARGGYDLATNASHFNLLSTVEWLLGLGSIAGNVSGDTFPALPQLFQFPVLWTLHGVVRSAATGAPISGAQVSVGGQPSEATDA